MGEQLSRANGHDAPIQTAADDLLNGLGMARAIHRVLSTAPPNWSTRVGLYGPWGSGKTSVLNLLRALEEADGSLVISFSAWSAIRESDVIAQFYQILAKRLREESIALPIWQRVKAKVAKVRHLGGLVRLGKKGIQEMALAPRWVTDAAAEVLSKLASTASAWAHITRKDLEAVAALLNGRRVVVFIDDLDRADPKVVPKTLLATRELLDWPGFSFVLAFDKRAISCALSEYSAAFGSDAQGFLEKVIDVPFEIRDASDVQRGGLARSAFKACCDLVPTEAISAIASALPSQPRRVKLIARMLGALRPSLARHESEEVDWIGLCLFLIIKEASHLAADWVVKAVTVEGTDWLLWLGEKNEIEKKEKEAKSILLGLLSRPEPPSDVDRVLNAALRLLRHWEMAADETVLYWVELAYREPRVTLNEVRQLREEFAQKNDPILVNELLHVAVANTGDSEQEVATECLTVGVESYRVALDSMADAHTGVEWEERHKDAQKSLLLLEYLWSQRSNESLAVAASQGATSALLLGVFARWLSWTRNAGEVALREREKQLALIVASNCVDPELLFAETDPFWNTGLSEDPASAEAMQSWRRTLRDVLAPRVVSRLCEKFLQIDGLAGVAAGEEKLGPWLVEKKESPLYANSDLTKQLVEVLSMGRGASDSTRSALSKNARLYLQQLLRQTRDASWGGVQEAEALNIAHPNIVPAAWAAVVDVPAPYRMHSSLRKLRQDLCGIGVSPTQLPEPAWLIAAAKPSVREESAKFRLDDGEVEER